MDFAVRSNLWQFLEAARTQLGHQILWIDALCINQSLTSERNHQVQQMGHIYNKALGVIVWLSGYSSALIFLQDNHLNPQRYTENCFSVGGKVSNATLTELLDLCEDEYWYRTWVIQEILLAKELHIMSQCGKFSWHALSYFLLRNKSTLDMEHSLPLRHATDHRTVLTKSRASILCRERQSTPGRMHACHLTDLVVKFGKSRCGDVRDRVLGLLGLADLGANKEFRVDYAMNVEALFHYMVESNYFRTSDRQEVYALASILELDFRIQSLLVLRPVMTFFKPEGKTKALFPTDLSLSDQTVSRASYQCHFCRADLVIYRDHFISQEPDWHALSTGRSGWKFDNAYFEPGWWPGLDPSDKHILRHEPQDQEAFAKRFICCLAIQRVREHPIFQSRLSTPKARLFSIAVPSAEATSSTGINVPSIKLRLFILRNLVLRFNDYWGKDLDGTSLDSWKLEGMGRRFM